MILSSPGQPREALVHEQSSLTWLKTLLAMSTWHSSGFDSYDWLDGDDHYAIVLSLVITVSHSITIHDSLQATSVDMMLQLPEEQHFLPIQVHETNLQQPKSMVLQAELQSGS